MCVLYGRGGYHALFLRPIAELLKCRYVALEYLELYQRYVEGKRGVYYVEEPWLHEGRGEAPEPPHRLPPQLRRLEGKMLPILGNVQAYVSQKAPCRALLAKPGEPLVTDLLLPLYLELRDPAEALRASKEAYRCAPEDPQALVDGVRKGTHGRGVVWTAWAPDIRLTHPPWGPPMSGVWGLVWVGERPTAIDAYAYPPPYLDVEWLEWSHAKPFLLAARPLRGPGWMPYVLRAWPLLYKYLKGRGRFVEARRAVEEIETYITP